MIRLLLRKDAVRVLFCVLIFMVGTFISTDSTRVWELRFADASTQYINQYFTGDRDEFYNTLSQSAVEANRLVEQIKAIVPEDASEEDFDLLGNYIGYTTYETEALRQSLLNSPGKYTRTVSDDSHMIGLLKQLMKQQQEIQVTRYNYTELMDRGLRRTVGHDPFQAQIYTGCKEQYEKIDTSQPPIYTGSVIFLLKHLQDPSTLYLLLFLLHFATFGRLTQNGLNMVALISDRGIRWFARKKILIACAVTTFAFVIFVVAEFMGTYPHLRMDPAMQLPIQTLADYNDLPWAINIGTYIVITLISEYLTCLVLSMVLLFCSMLARNTINAGLYCAIPVVLLQLLQNYSLPIPATVSGLLSGRFSVLFWEYPYWNIFGTAVFAVPLYFILLLGVGIVTALLTIWIAPIIVCD